MDPDEALRRIREYQGTVFRLTAKDELNEDDLFTLRVAAQLLAQHVEALDCWLGNGGFLPEAWRAPIAARILRHIVTGMPDAKLHSNEEAP